MKQETLRFGRPTIPIIIKEFLLQASRDRRGIHVHKAMEIVRVKSGRMLADVDGSLTEVEQGSILLINGNIAHKLSAESAEITLIQVDLSKFIGQKSDDEFAALYEFVLSAKRKPYLATDDEGEIRELFDKIVRAYYESSERGEWYLTAYLYELAAFLYTHSFIVPTAQAGVELEKIRPIVALIDRNYTAPLTLDDLSESVGYGKYTICHLFKAVTGSTVFEYINFLRIRLAAEKLGTANASVSQVAGECGFSSLSYFNRVFKKILGCAPSKYRKYV